MPCAVKVAVIYWNWLANFVERKIPQRADSATDAVIH
jgi:hypothetical protein